MIQFKINKHGIKTNLIYYHKNEDLSKSDINVFIEAYEKPDKKYEIKRTLFSDLTFTEEELFNKIEKNCKYKIRRADNKDELTIKFYYNTNLTDDIVEQFIKFYDSFTKNKGFDESCDKGMLKKMKEDGKLMISFSYQNDVLLVAHAYVVGEDIVRLWYSCSSYRNSDNQFRSLVGRANRNLHWKDMLYFKEKAVKIYDWGGISDREEIKNITAFKKEFGGDEKVLYNYRVVKTFKGKLFLFICKLLGRK